MFQGRFNSASPDNSLTAALQYAPIRTLKNWKEGQTEAAFAELFLGNLDITENVGLSEQIQRK